MDQETRIKAKVKAREDAREIAEMLSWEDGTGADYAEAFVKELRARLPVREQDKPKPPPKPEPIARLGATEMGYGAFAGQTFDDIPLDRLDWYLRMAEENARQLRAYLKHPELKSRRRD